MKLKSLILGSVAAAGLSTAGFAADLGVLTSLDVCDSLGISGLTISSADNCLAISGKVSYEFNWGDFNSNWFGAPAQAGVRSVIAPDFEVDAAGDEFNNDWNSKVEAWLKFVGTASSDFGPASATIKLKSVQHSVVANEGYRVVAPAVVATNEGPTAGDSTTGFVIDEAFVSIGDTTTIMAGKKGSVAKFGDDEPFNWLGLFNSDAVDKGVMFAKNHPKTGGHVIQVVSSLGNGITVKAGLENLDSAAAAAFGTTPDAVLGAPTGFYNGVTAAQAAGTLVGVVEYAGDGITAHVTALAGGVLDGIVEDWAVHAGVTGTFDAFKVRVAGAYSANNADDSYWNVLGSAEGTFDMFTIALSGEANGGQDNGVAIATQAGFGASISATVTEGVKLNLGGRWIDTDTATPNNEGYQIAASLVAAVTETIELGAEAGVYGKTVGAGSTDFYGKADLTWKPGGSFESSLGAEVHQNGAYKVTFKASKEFK